jgi:hypothetical protein
MSNHRRADVEVGLEDVDELIGALFGLTKSEREVHDLRKVLKAYLPKVTLSERRKGWEMCREAVMAAVKKDKRFGGLMRVALLHLLAALPFPEDR